MGLPRVPLKEAKGSLTTGEPEAQPQPQVSALGSNATLPDPLPSDDLGLDLESNTPNDLEEDENELSSFGESSGLNSTLGETGAEDRATSGNSFQVELRSMIGIEEACQEALAERNVTDVAKIVSDVSKAVSGGSLNQTGVSYQVANEFTARIALKIFMNEPKSSAKLVNLDSIILGIGSRLFSSTPLQPIDLGQRHEHRHCQRAPLRERCPELQ